MQNFFATTKTPQIHLKYKTNKQKQRKNKKQKTVQGYTVYTVDSYKMTTHL